MKPPEEGEGILYDPETLRDIQAFEAFVRDLKPCDFEVWNVGPDDDEALRRDENKKGRFFKGFDRDEFLS